jgi:hypothetical protein
LLFFFFHWCYYSLHTGATTFHLLVLLFFTHMSLKELLKGIKLWSF